MAIVTIHVLSATVITRPHGCDRVYIHTNMRNPVFPFNDDLDFGFDAAKGRGAAYVRETFNMEPTIIQL